MNTMQVDKSEIQNKKSLKRDLTKKKIIDATLHLIAQHGLSYLSHRLIAKEANVRLSLTSYYFGSLDNLIEAAFDEFNTQSQFYRANVQEQMGKAYLQCIEQYSPQQVTLEYISALTELLADYFQSGLEERQQNLRIESHFVYELNFPPSLTTKIEDFINTLVEEIELSCQRIGSQNLKSDTYVTVALIRQIEFGHAYSNRPYDREFIRVTLKRLFLSFSSLATEICIAE